MMGIASAGMFSAGIAGPGCGFTCSPWEDFLPGTVRFLKNWPAKTGASFMTSMIDSAKVNQADRTQIDRTQAGSTFRVIFLRADLFQENPFESPGGLSLLIGELEDVS